jgi:hypothetical protein
MYTYQSLGSCYSAALGLAREYHVCALAGPSRTLMVSISFSDRLHDMAAAIQGLPGPVGCVVAKVLPKRRWSSVVDQCSAPL